MSRYDFIRFGGFVNWADEDTDTFRKMKVCLPVNIIRKTKCFDFWERNVLFPKTKRSFFRTPTLPFSA